MPKAAPLPAAPPLGEPPEPPLPQLRLKSLSARVATLKQKGGGPIIHLRDVTPSKRPPANPVQRAAQRAPITHKLAEGERVRAQASASAKAQRAAQPGPLAKAGEGAGEGAATAVVERVQQARQGARQRAADAGPATPATPRSGAERAADLRRRVDALDAMDERVRQVADKYTAGYIRAQKGQVTKMAKRAQAEREAAEYAALLRTPDKDPARLKELHDRIAARETAMPAPGAAAPRRAITPEDVRQRAAEAAGELKPQPPQRITTRRGQLGPSGETRAEREASARASIAAQERIANNPELSRTARRKAREEIRRLREHVLGESDD